MEFTRAIKGYNHLWSIKEPDKEADELGLLFKKWNNIDYLLAFFKENIDDLRRYFKIEKISLAIKDSLEDADALEELILEFPFTEQLDGIFKPLSSEDATATELSREKARNWTQNKHASWMRIYAIRLEPNVYIVTGGAIKLTPKMQDKEHTRKELDKLNACKNYFIRNHVFDKDSFIGLIEEK